MTAPPRKQTLWQMIMAGCRRLVGAIGGSSGNENRNPSGSVTFLETDAAASSTAGHLAPNESGQSPRPSYATSAPSYAFPTETAMSQADGRRFLAALDSGRQVRITNKILHMLAPMPGTAMKLLQLLSQPDVSISKLATLAGTDVGLTSALLRRANSTVFSFSRSIGAVDEAIKVIGLTQTRSIVLASGVSEIAQRAMPLYELPAGAFIAHCEAAAQATALAAAQAGVPDIGLAYSAGLLHDLGKIILSGFVRQMEIPECSLRLIMDERKCSMLDAELRLFGATHAQVGKQLADLWALPSDLALAIAQHHDPHAAYPARDLAYCLILGNALAGRCNPEYPRLSNASELEFPAWLDAAAIADQLVRTAS